VMKEMDPFCRLSVEKSANGELDPFPCFAAVDPILKTLTQGNDPSITANIHDAMINLETNLAVRMSFVKDGATIDWMNLYDLDHEARSVGGKRLLLGILVYYYYSSNMALGYMDGFGDVIWRQAMAQGQSPAQALGTYIQAKREVQVFKQLRADAVARGIQFSLEGVPLAKDWDRHNAVSAFLACYYEEKGEDWIAQFVPEFVGRTYKKLKSIQLRREGMSEHDVQAYYQDGVQRYQVAAKIGYEFCR